MNSGEIHAYHHATRQPVRVSWQDGIISQAAPAARAPENLWLAPGLFDVQVNGYGGIDFQQDNLKEADLLTATRLLREGGCTKYLLTLITDDWSRLTARLRHLRAVRSQSPELQSAIVGWHIEGPFLSAEPGFHGAHNPAFMLNPTAADIQSLRTITGNDPLMLTVSPERPGVIEAIALATSLGIKISLGHTNASAMALHQAVKAGATGFTHLGNGCPRELDRHDNILWRVFETSGLTVGLIPDQIHVSSPLFRLIHRTLGADSIYYTTDAMSAAGAPPGRYKLGALELEVGPDQIVRQPGKTNFAGSALRPIDGIMRAAQMLRRPWQEVWKSFSEVPARMLGVNLKLEKGEPANFCVMKVAGENQVTELKVITQGVG